MGIRFISADDIKDIEQARKSIMQSETNLSQANHTIRHLESEIAKLVQELTLAKLDAMRVEPEVIAAQLKFQTTQQKQITETAPELVPQTYNDLKALERIEELKIANQKLREEIAIRDAQIKKQNTKIVCLECEVGGLKSELVKIKKAR